MTHEEYICQFYKWRRGPSAFVEEYFGVKLFPYQKAHIDNLRSKQMQVVYKECIKMAENEIQERIFSDWWNGISIYSKDERGIDNYRADRFLCCTCYDWEKAHDIILYAVSCGCG